MFERKTLAACLLSLTFLLPACGKKRKIVTDLERAPSVDTRLIMSDNLSPKLKEAGLSDEQTETIVKKGKSKPAAGNLTLNSDTILADVKAFTSGSTDALDEIGSLPTGKSKTQILKIIMGSNIKVLKLLKTKVPDLNLKTSVAAVASAASASLDDAGFTAAASVSESDSMKEAMREMSASVTENADDAGLAQEDINGLLEDSLKAVILSFRDISTVDRTTYHDLILEISSGFMSGFSEFSGFTREMYSNSSETVGRTVMDIATDMRDPQDTQNVFLKDMMRAVNSGVLLGVVSYADGDTDFYKSVTERVSSGTMSSVLSYESINQDLLNALRMESMMGIQDAATILNQTQADFSVDVSVLRDSAQTATEQVVTADTTITYDSSAWNAYLSSTTTTTTDGMMVDCSRDPTNSFCTAASTTGTSDTLTTNTTTNTTTTIASDSTSGSTASIYPTLSCTQDTSSNTIVCTNGTFQDFCIQNPNDSLCSVNVDTTSSLYSNTTLSNGSTLLYPNYTYQILSGTFTSSR
ncbi:MAG: hypothetical protein RIR26_1954 [Pseudomonadota bacterium]|jgi:hypothetical protein